MTATGRAGRVQSDDDEPRSIETVSGDLHRRMEDALKALEMLRTQHATCNSLLHQVQSELDVALRLERELVEVVRHKAEEPSSVVATLQAAVEKTKDTVIGQVEHVREQAVAAFHRIKGDGPRVENGQQENPPSAKGPGHDIG